MSDIDNETMNSIEREEEIEESYASLTGNSENLEHSTRAKKGSHDLRTPRQKYCERWELEFTWLKPDKIDDSLGICTICDRRLVCKKSHLERHQSSFKHQRNSGIDPVTIKPDNAFAVFLDNDEDKRDSDDYELEHLEQEEISSSKLKTKNKKQSPESVDDASIIKREIRRPMLQKVQKANKGKLDRLNLLKRIDRDRNELNEYYYRNQKQFSLDTPSPKTQQQQQQQRDSFDLFFESVSASVKSLPLKLSYEVKSKISQLLSEFELRALCEKEAMERASREGTSLQPVLVSPSFEDDTKDIQVTTSIDASVPHLVYTFQQKPQ